MRCEVRLSEEVLIASGGEGLLAVQAEQVSVTPVIAVPAVVAAQHGEGRPELTVAVVLLVAVRREERLGLHGGAKGLEEALIEVGVRGREVGIR